MVELAKASMCVGCGACSASCPTKSITMIQQDDGFLYPSINMHSCIGCHKCEEVCPIINNSFLRTYTKSAYVAKNKNVVDLKNSTSGGIAYVISKVIIEHGGVVVGCALDDVFSAKHIIVDNINDLHRLQGSKYIQSYIEESVYKNIKLKIKEGLNVCFFGTACQIQALKSFLGGNANNLFTIEVVCRAVPSPGVFSKYLEYMRYVLKDDISDIQFRYKKKGYTFTGMRITTKNGKEYFRGIEADPWLRCFFSGICNREACSQCIFKTIERVSDITIWDCFNYNTITRELDGTLGASSMLINTERGKELFLSTIEYLDIEEVNYEQLVSSCHEMVACAKLSKNVTQFAKDNKNLNGIPLFKKYFPLTLKYQVMYYIRDFLVTIKLYNIIKRLFKK